QQEQLAIRLRRGEDAKVVLSDFFPQRTKKHCKPNDALASFVRSLTAACLDLTDRVDDVGIRTLKSHEPALRKGMQMIRKLLARSKLPIPPSILSELLDGGTT